MPVDVANFLAKNAYTPPRSEIDRATYSNALLRNQVSRIPQANRAQDLEIQAQDQQIKQAQRANAAGIASNMTMAVVQSQDPVAEAQRLFSNPQFVDAVKFLGFKAPSFDPTKDTADSLRQDGMTFLRALGGGSKPVEMSQGSALVDPTTGREVYRNPAAGPQATDDQREYQTAVQQGFKGSFIDYMTMMRKAGATSIDMRSPPQAPQGMTYVKDEDPNNALGYKLVTVPGARDQRTEAQQKAGLLSQRMKTLSQDILDTAPGLTDQLAATLAQSGGVKGSIANSYLKPELQKHFNAARGWLAGVLRQDTGATIQPFEIQEYYPTFFPVPGDSLEVIKQKRRLREVTVNAISANSGLPGAQQQTTAEFDPPANGGWSIRRIP